MNKIATIETAQKHMWATDCGSYTLVATDTLSVKQEVMKWGTRERLHKHIHAQQFFFVLKGIAVFYVDQERFEVSEGQGIQIDPGQQHYVENAGAKDLEFLVISQPSTINDRININES